MAMALLTALTSPAAAQSASGNLQALALDRPGYELGRWRVGNITLYPELDLVTVYDSNLFSTSTNAQDAVRFEIAPRIRAIYEGNLSRFELDAFANARLHNRYTTEDRFTFGGGARLQQALDSRSQFEIAGHFDRAVQRRADPEVDAFLRRPALFDSASATIGIRHQIGRFTISARAELQTVDFLAADEADRDLISYRLPIRAGYAVSPRMGVFVEPFVNRRDARLAFDRNGIDRDVTTIGALAGVSFDLADRLKGEIGFGGFSASPDGPLPAFTGFAMNGKLRWQPAMRTAFTLEAYQGDVATIQSGAGGRIDTRVSVRVDQEFRHNLLGWASVGYRGTSYRGSERRLDLVTFSGELEYLVSRTLSVYVSARHDTRGARFPLDRFDQSFVGLGVRVRT